MPSLPLLIAVTVVAISGFVLLNRADAQARDTIRKHHLADVEDALYLAYRQHGTYPPYDQPTWCGVLSGAESAAVRTQIETVLRQRIEKYANPTKPFPQDPRPADRDYFYWKRSPAVFELYARLEADPNGERNTFRCPTMASPASYDYGLNSYLRQDTVSLLK